jgi:hypothetical protein
MEATTRLMESTSGQLINKALAAVLFYPNQQSTNCSAYAYKGYQDLYSEDDQHFLAVTPSNAFA